ETHRGLRSAAGPHLARRGLRRKPLRRRGWTFPPVPVWFRPTGKETPMTFTIATWNINSVRLREGLVARLMQEEAPDILCLQECKSPVEKIPLEAFRTLGYGHIVARGQKGYNGVAILSKLPLREVGAHDFVDL